MTLIGYDFTDAVDYHYGKFPPKDINYKRLLTPLSNAAAEIARYDATMKTLRNSNLLLAPLKRREAVISSRIEGTVATIDEVLKLEADENERDTPMGARQEVVEVLSYSRALTTAQRMVSEGIPLSGRVIKQAHRELLLSGRGADQQPGEFKSEQNFVVDKNKKKVLFVPIKPAEFNAAFKVYEEYINSDDDEKLIQIALSHVEFEALHPFKDGNGRVGRMLVTLMLWTKGLISAPHFYISGELEADKDQYIDRMRAVSQKGDWTEWSVFFLDALSKQAKHNIIKAQAIIDLYNQMKAEFQELLSSQWTINALDYIFTKPVFRNSSFVTESGIPRPSANRISSTLATRGILQTLEPSSGRRAALYAFEPLLKIVRE